MLSRSHGRDIFRATAGRAIILKGNAMKILSNRLWLAVALVLPIVGNANAQSPELTIHFIDVGQGDCTLIECPGGNKILVDCGSVGGGDAQAVREYLLEQLDATSPRIDTLIITHPDRDHYNLVSRVLSDDIEVGQLIMVGDTDEHDQGGFDDWADTVELDDEDSFIILDDPDFHELVDLAADDRTCDCGDADVSILAASVVASRSATNARSIVLLVTLGDFDVLLTGDATTATERVIINRYVTNGSPDALQCEVLKIGHHGSSTTSTGVAFAAAVAPNLAVVSCSFGNSFRHPRQIVIDRLTPFTDESEPHVFRWGNRDISTGRFSDFSAFTEAIYSTATNGTIVITADAEGYSITYQTQTTVEFGDN